MASSPSAVRRKLTRLTHLREGMTSPYYPQHPPSKRSQLQAEWFLRWEEGFYIRMGKFGRR